MRYRLALAVVAMQLMQLGHLSGTGCSSKREKNGAEATAQTASDAAAAALRNTFEFHWPVLPADAPVVPGPIRLTSPEDIFRANTAYEDVVVLVQGIKRQVMEQLAGSETSFELTVELGLHGQRDHSITLRAEPALPPDVADPLRTALTSLPTVRSRGPDLTLEMYYEIRGSR